MDKWKQICGLQAARLKSALELCKHAQALANHGKVSSWLDKKDITSLESAKKNINKKMPRLENGEFHIAVVGTEKAGKSSFINAWLESDLLPNKQARCTFTTTKLHSVDSRDKQCLKVLPKTREEFAELCKILENEAANPNEKIARDAKDDLKMIDQNRASMDEVIANGELIIPFSTLEDIHDDLYKYAADGAYAHAIKQLDLYTTSLASMDGILFYDVPGLNSGLTKHIRETEQMLGDSDAVIIVKPIGYPTIEGSEKQILEYARLGDETVPVKDKIFFFISRIDGMETKSGLEKNKTEFLGQLDSFNIDKNKVVFGAAPAVLMLKDRLAETDYIKPTPDLKKHLAELLDLPNTEDQTVLNAAGVSEMRGKIEDYLDNEREVILRRGVNTLLEQIDSAARNIQNEVKKHVPENPTEAKRAHAREINRAFEDWLDKFLTKIRASLENDSSATLVEASTKEMRDSYSKLAETKIDNLKYFTPAVRDQFFSSQSVTYGEDFATLNTTLRRHIYDEEILPLIHELSASLSTDLYQRLIAYMDSLSENFNNSINVRNIIMEAMGVKSAEVYKAHLESAMGALFLRFARPLAEGLLRFRHGVKDRTELARKLSPTLHSLSNFYPDDLPDEYVNLPKYISRGDGSPSAKPDQASDKAAAKNENCNSREEIAKELEADRAALKNYLVNSIFDCSGIGEFAQNEVERIRRTFLASENSLRADVKTAYEYKDPQFMALLPDSLRQTECDTRISDLLHQLTMALKQKENV